MDVEDYTVVQYGEESLTYTSGKEFYTTPKRAKQTLEKFGIAIIPGCLNQEECNQMNKGMWQTAEFLTSKLKKPLIRSLPKTYSSIFELTPRAGGLIQNWGWSHAQYAWDVRSNPKVAEVFEEVFETKDLLVSFDAINCGLGALIPSNSSQIGIYNGQSNLHCDQRYTMNNFECVQSWITANPIDVGDGTLRVLQGSHKLHEEFRKVFLDHPEDKDWYVLNEEQIQWYKDKGCKEYIITCPQGTQVCWDSRTIHCGMKPLSREYLPFEIQKEARNFRNVLYVCMMPAWMCPPHNLQIRRAILNPNGGDLRLRSASHWPHYMNLFPAKAKSKIVDIQVPEMPIPVLTNWGQKIAGII